MFPAQTPTGCQGKRTGCKKYDALRAGGAGGAAETSKGVSGTEDKGPNVRCGAKERKEEKDTSVSRADSAASDDSRLASPVGRVQARTSRRYT